jgi:hypothetical protein
VAAASRATHSTGSVRAIHRKNPNHSPNVAWTSVATMADGSGSVTGRVSATDPAGQVGRRTGLMPMQGDRTGVGGRG